MRPQLDADRLAHGEAGELLFRQADGHFPLTVRGQGEDCLPGGNHLADLDLALGYDTRLRCTQYGVFGLVAGHLELGLRLLQPRLAGTEQVFGIVVLRVADHLPVQQLLVAVTLGTHQRQVGLGARQLGAVGFQLQAHVLGVEFSQRLLGVHPLALFDQALGDLAGDTKCQFRLEPRPYFTGVAVRRGLRRLRLNDQRRARCCWRSGLLATGCQEQRGGNGQSEGQGMTQHDESFRDGRIEYLYWRVY